jgi:1-deoxy-D-xylulose-5-phosphate synthase
MDAAPAPIPVGKGRILASGRDLTFLAIGNRVHPALKAAELLKKAGIDAGVADMRFVKPLDTELVRTLAAAGPLITVEDNALAGGFGSAVLEYLNVSGSDARLLRLGIPDAYVEHGKVDELYADLGLDAEGLARCASAWLRKKALV